MTFYTTMDRTIAKRFMLYINVNGTYSVDFGLDLAAYLPQIFAGAEFAGAEEELQESVLADINLYYIFLADLAEEESQSYV